MAVVAHAQQDDVEPGEAAAARLQHVADLLLVELTKRGVGNGVYYPTPIHELPSFKLKLSLPQTSRAAQEALSLPVHPALKKRDLVTIVETVNAIAKAGS